MTFVRKNSEFSAVCILDLFRLNKIKESCIRVVELDNFIVRDGNLSVIFDFSKS